MNFTILIGTCDKYCFLWDNFIQLFNKYWDHSIECEKYFLSETIPPLYDNFKYFLPGKIPYSECIKHALNNISTDYVLWLQDDYLFRKKIDKQKFNWYMNFINDNHVDRFGICEDSDLYTKIHIKDNLYRLYQYSLYSISMQASIWKKDFFLSCLGPNENPWQFEVHGSMRLNDKQHYIYYDKQDPPWYVEGMRKGEFTQEYFKVKEEEKLK